MSSILGTADESELGESPDQLQVTVLRIQGSLEKHSLPAFKKFFDKTVNMSWAKDNQPTLLGCYNNPKLSQGGNFFSYIPVPLPHQEQNVLSAWVV